MSKESVNLKLSKARWHLLAPEAQVMLVKVLMFGAEKHGEREWENEPMDWSLPYNAAMRHMTAFWSGEEHDPETGYPHTAHAEANMHFLTTYMSRRIGKDDRPTTKPSFDALMQKAVEMPIPAMRETCSICASAVALVALAGKLAPGRP